MTVKIIIGDALSQLKELQDESVHCCVTSPPYWGLRAYKGDSGMIGLEPTFDEHLDNLVAVFREVRRVLRSDGTLWLNYSDAYSSGNGKMQWAASGTPVRGGERRGKSSGLKPKDLMMMPALVAMALRDDGAVDVRAMRAIERIGYDLADEYRAADEEMPDPVRRVLDRLAKEYAQAKGDSWWLRSEIIWHKPNPMPESVTDRPTSAHEKMFLLSKSARYFYDAEAVSESATCDRTRGPALHPDPVSTNGNAGLSRRDSGGARNLRNVWKISTHSFSEAHFATFPPKLVEPCIKAGTSEQGVCGECGGPWARSAEQQGTGTMTKKPDGWDTGEGAHGTVHRSGREAGETMEVTRRVTTGWSPSCDHGSTPVPATVLDCFAGSGTVGLVADRLGRDAILVDISPEYAEMARKRIHDDAPLFANVRLVD